MGSFLRLVNGVPTMVDQFANIYDETYTVSGTLTAGTDITLPSSGSYSGDELRVYHNGVLMDVLVDYNYIGSPPRTAIEFTFDLYDGDLVRFRID